MYAIVEINGKQYQIEEGRYVVVDLLDNEPETALELDKVLMIADGKATKIGAPYVEGAKVTAKVLSHYKDKKVLVYKMKRKKGYRRKNGHRQQYTRLQIDAISA
jgi:large subunit ribosomal protein L21